MDAKQYDQNDDEDPNDIDFAYYHDSLRDLSEHQMSLDYYDDDEDFDPSLAEFPPEAVEPFSLLESVWTDCTVPIFSQSFPSSFSLVLLSLVLPLLQLAGSPKTVIHCSSACLGLAASVVFFPDSWQLLCGIGVGSGLLFLFSSYICFSCRSRIAFVSASLLAAAVHFELTMDGSQWHTLRGPAQLVAMKIISLAIDDETPRFEELFGYLFCPGENLALHHVEWHRCHTL